MWASKAAGCRAAASKGAWWFVDQEEWCWTSSHCSGWAASGMLRARLEGFTRFDLTQLGQLSWPMQCAPSSIQQHMDCTCLCPA
jgi:hypothetical protein